MNLGDIARALGVSVVSGFGTAEEQRARADRKAEFEEAMALRRQTQEALQAYRDEVLQQRSEQNQPYDITSLAKQLTDYEGPPLSVPNRFAPAAIAALGAQGRKDPTLLYDPVTGHATGDIFTRQTKALPRIPGTPPVQALGELGNITPPPPVISPGTPERLAVPVPESRVPTFLQDIRKRQDEQEKRDAREGAATLYSQGDITPEEAHRQSGAARLGLHIQDWLGTTLAAPEKTQLTEASQTDISLHDPDPQKRRRASENLLAMQSRKLEMITANAGATEKAKQEADVAIARAVIKESNLTQNLLDGKISPGEISQSFRQPYVTILAVGEAMKRDPTYNWIEADANMRWYQSPTTQRLIRRTESIVAPGGAADEAKRFASLVNNPAGTPINRLTGAAKVAFGNSQRALLSLVQGITSEEVQQIMGAQGGGERFLEFTQALNDPNLSVTQYVNNVNELEYLIYTRQVANVRGTPAQKKWEQMGGKFTTERPFTPSRLRGQSTNKPDGTYRHPDGTTVTVKDGVIQ